MVRGGPGKDIVCGGTGQDKADGDGGADEVYGEEGDDRAALGEEQVHWRVTIRPAG